MTRFVIAFKTESSKAKFQEPTELEQASSLAELLRRSEAIAGVIPSEFVRIFNDEATIVSVPESQSANYLSRMRGSTDVLWIEEDRLISVQAEVPLSSSVTLLNPLQARRYWQHERAAIQPAGVNSADMWNFTHGSAEAVVAVLDTGVLFGHPMLQGSLLSGYDFVSDSFAGNDRQTSGKSDRDADASDPGDGTTTADTALAGRCSAGTNSSWHGTFVAGIIAGNVDPSQGVLPTTWNASVLPIRVLGKCGGLSTDLADAIRWAAGLPVSGVPVNQTPADVINLSVAANGACISNIEGRAIAEARSAGAVVIAAAGNAGGAVGSPANCPGVIGVGAVDQRGLKTSYSNFGPEVDIVAPGGDRTYPIWSAGNDGLTSPLSHSYRAKTGTSFAAPFVSAVAAAMKSIAPSASSNQIESALLDGARTFLRLTGSPTCADTLTNTVCNCTSTTCGRGMLDAYGAISGFLLSQSPVNLQATHSKAVSVGESVTFTANTNSAFTIQKVVKSKSNAANPVLRVNGSQATVTMPSGIAGFTVVASNGSTSANAVVVPAQTSVLPTNPISGAVDLIAVALGAGSSSPGNGFEQGTASGGSSPNSGQTSSNNNAVVSSGGGGSITLLWLLFLCVVVLYRFHRNYRLI